MKIRTNSKLFAAVFGAAALVAAVPMMATAQDRPQTEAEEEGVPPSRSTTPGSPPR